MRTLLTDGRIDGKRQNLLIDNELVSYIGLGFPVADRTVDLNGMSVMPGMIDPHTHIRDLGQTEKEDWTSASKAALRGGVTTVFDMPNNRPPTINLKNLNLKRAVAKKALMNYKFNIAATAYNLEDVKEILDAKPDDVSALKLFLAGSNSNEFENDPEVIRRIFDLSLHYDIPVIIHTEWQACVKKFSDQVKNPTVLNHNFIRNRECAAIGTKIVLDLAQAIGNKIYIAHTSVVEELDLIREYKNKVHVFCEVTPHHLLINETVLDVVGNYGKVNPPLRTQKDNDAMWAAIADGTIDTIGSDHAPHRLSEKNRPYLQAPSGFPGLETSLPLLLQEVKKGSLSMKKLIALTSTNSADIFGLNKLGKLQVGYRADLAIFDNSVEAMVDSASFETKAKYSPYEGMKVVPIKMTFINGKQIE